MNLKEIIFNEVREEVSQNGGLYFANPNEAIYRLALDRLDTVYKWASLNGWVYQLPIGEEEYWMDRVWFHAEKYKESMRHGLITESELYDQWLIERGV